MNLENTILADRNQKAGKKLIIGKLFYFYDRKEYFVIDIGTRIIIVQIKLHFFSLSTSIFFLVMMSL